MRTTARSTAELLGMASAEVRDDPKRCLELLLEVWRRTNAPAVAEVIDLVSSHVAEAEPPIAAAKGESGKQMFVRVLGERRTESLERLLEALPDGNDRVLRLKALIAVWERDPRVTRAAIGWIEEPTVKGPSRRAFVAAIFQLLEHVGDPRGIERLERLASSRVNLIKVGQENWKLLPALITKLRAVRVTPLGAEDEATLGAVRGRLGVREKSAEPDIRALLAAVYADPDSDEARAVLSDALQQQGDPRGEHMALQLARRANGAKRSSREKELEDRWGRTWLGPIEPHVMKSGVVFERGFLVECRFLGEPSARATFECDEWSTVRTMHCAFTKRGQMLGLLFAAKLSGLRHVIGLRIRDIEAILERGLPLSWETVGVDNWNFDQIVPFLERCPTLLPNAKTFIGASFRSFDREDAVTLSGHVERWSSLSSIDVEVRLSEEPGLQLLRATKDRLDRIVLRSQGIATDVRPREARAHVTLELNPKTGATLSAIVTVLGREQLVRELRIDIGGRVKLEGNTLRSGKTEIDWGAVVRAATLANMELSTNLP